jgi:HKD family nuclease
MKTSVVLQPSNIKMGEIINELLSSENPFYNKVWLISAFANAQAIDRLAENILASKNHGAEISITVGFDVKSTSAEALQSINSLGVNSTLVHNARRGHTFHPKIYLFEATDSKAELFVGSSNLTDGGLYTNYEASSQITFNFPQDMNEYAEILASLDRYINPQGNTAQVLNNSLIDILVRRGEVPTEREIIENRRQSLRAQDRSDSPASPFGVEIINRPSRTRRRTTPSVVNQPRRTRRSNSTPIEPSPQNITRDLVWQKTNLPASDVQRQTGNVTGGLRLTQARWSVNDNPIDQTTYFRNEVFGNLVWREWRTSPYSERTEVDFDINILGESYGIHQLMISHKPSGEAGQHNYTTILHWGELGDIIRELNLIGRTFSLYSPPSGEIEPFTIHIT